MVCRLCLTPQRSRWLSSKHQVRKLFHKYSIEHRTGSLFCWADPVCCLFLRERISCFLILYCLLAQNKMRRNWRGTATELARATCNVKAKINAGVVLWIAFLFRQIILLNFRLYYEKPEVLIGWIRLHRGAARLLCLGNPRTRRLLLFLAWTDLLFLDSVLSSLGT